MIKVSKDLYINGPQIFINTNGIKIGVISDTHIGYMRFLNKSGILIEDNQAKNIINSLENINKNNKKKLNTFIINGDLFHEFSKIDFDTISDAKKIITFIINNVADEVIVIKGNHDKIIEKVFNEISNNNKKIILKEHYNIGKYTFTHGDKIIFEQKIKNGTDKKEDMINNTVFVIGHEHPSIKINSKTRREEYKIIIINKKIIVTPSFNFIIEGHNILEDKLFSPYLASLSKEEFENSHIYAILKIEDSFETLELTTIKNILKNQYK